MSIETRLKRAGLIVAAGLLIQMLSLLPVHPLAFIAFVGVGVPVTGIGVLLFLLALIGVHESSAGTTQVRSGPLEHATRR